MTSKQVQKQSAEQSIESRAMGCLMGQAVGDALGTRYEFSGAETTKKQISKDVEKNDHLPILGGDQSARLLDADAPVKLIAERGA